MMHLFVVGVSENSRAEANLTMETAMCQEMHISRTSPPAAAVPSLTAGEAVRRAEMRPNTHANTDSLTKSPILTQIVRDTALDTDVVGACEWKEMIS